MATFVLTPRPSKNSTGPADMAPWTAWFEQLGASVVDHGKPVFERGAVGNCGTDTVLGGYFLLTADNLEAAVALARGCPTIGQGGGIEVGELGDL